MSAVDGVRKPPVILLMGPTASGKTMLAKALYQRIPSVIINVDSAQFYRGTDIGSAKISESEQRAFPHRMLSFLDPCDVYSVGDFYADAMSEIKMAINAGKTPILVGGTMMYFRLLQHGLSELPKADPVVRKRLAQSLEAYGSEYLHQKLALCDVDSAKRLHPNDPQRIMRALEVFEVTGKPLSFWHAQQKPQQRLDWEWLPIVLFPQQRQYLHQRIEARFDDMLQRGFVAEVEKLYQRPDTHAQLPIIKAVGYRQIWLYLEGQLEYAKMRERGIIATRQFAKRQYTWLRKWESAKMFDNSFLLVTGAAPAKEILEQQFISDVMLFLRDKNLHYINS